MKKLLGSALALALFVSVGTANAELLKNFKFGGSVEMDAVSARNVSNFKTRSYNNNVPNDHVGTAQTRIMLNMDWDLLDDVHSKVTLRKNNRVYGNAASESLTAVQGFVVLDQAYFKIDKVFGFLDSTFGRQFYGEPGDLIAYYGPAYDQYGLQVTAIDGARFDWTGEKAYATVVVFEPTGHPGLGSSNYVGIKDIRGFIAGNKGNENFDGKAYVWNQATHGGMNSVATPPGLTTKNDNLYVLGAKVKAKLGGLYGSLEAALNFGENRAGAVSERYAGKALLADVGMKADVEQIGMFNPWAQFGWGSGNGDSTNANNHNMNFTPIATDFRPGAIYGRFDAANAGAVILGNGVTGMPAGTMASNGLTNKIMYAIGVKATPAGLNKLTAGLAMYAFRFQNIGDNMKPAGTTISALTGGHRSIGQEYDLTAEWKHSENVSLKGTVGNFQPGDAIRFVANATPGNTTNSAWMSAFDVAVKF
ncbi:MAG: alginate export family protein [Elusimicrobia bacterium]|nr:alginate export family protein [Elusimicrobiota bacterium]